MQPSAAIDDDEARALRLVPPFGPGDLVVLRSGGPLMVVSRAGGHWVWCQWFRDKELQTASNDGHAFAATSLRPASWLDRLGAALGA